MKIFSLLFTSLLLCSGNFAQTQNAQNINELYVIEHEAGKIRNEDGLRWSWMNSNNVVLKEYFLDDKSDGVIKLKAIDKSIVLINFAKKHVVVLNGDGSFKSNNQVTHFFRHDNRESFSEFVRVCGEGETYPSTEVVDAAYGAAGKYVFANGIKGPITFDNANFSDPIYGVAKSGYVRLRPETKPVGIGTKESQVVNASATATSAANNEPSILDDPRAAQYVEEAEMEKERFIAKMNARKSKMTPEQSAARAGISLEEFQAREQERIDSFVANYIKRKMEHEDGTEASYNDWLRIADKAFSEGNFELAATHYQNASILKPGEAYPKDQKAAANQKIQDAKDTEHRAREDEERRLAEKEAARIRVVEERRIREQQAAEATAAAAAAAAANAAVKPAISFYGNHYHRITNRAMTASEALDVNEREQTPFVGTINTAMHPSGWNCEANMNQYFEINPVQVPGDRNPNVQKYTITAELMGQRVLSARHQNSTGSVSIHMFGMQHLNDMCYWELTRLENGYYKIENYKIKLSAFPSSCLYMDANSKKLFMSDWEEGKTRNGEWYFEIIDERKNIVPIDLSYAPHYVNHKNYSLVYTGSVQSDFMVDGFKFTNDLNTIRRDQTLFTFKGHADGTYSVYFDQNGVTMLFNGDGLEDDLSKASNDFYRFRMMPIWGDGYQFIRAREGETYALQAKPERSRYNNSQITGYSLRMVKLKDVPLADTVFKIGRKL